MEHIFNCHGEWAALFSCVTSIPVLRYWYKSKKGGNLITDIVIGLQHGDEGKGKVTHHLLKSGEYTHCVRFNGGCNAGHTIYHDGVRLVTHHIPAGVFFWRYLCNW